MPGRIGILWAGCGGTRLYSQYSGGRLIAEFEASRVYKVSSSSRAVIQRKPVLKNRKRILWNYKNEEITWKGSMTHQVLHKCEGLWCKHSLRPFSPPAEGVGSGNIIWQISNLMFPAGTSAPSAAEGLEERRREANLQNWIQKSPRRLKKNGVFWDLSFLLTLRYRNSKWWPWGSQADYIILKYCCPT